MPDHDALTGVSRYEPPICANVAPNQTGRMVQ
jgi:hypothetical protein